LDPDPAEIRLSGDDHKHPQARARGAAKGESSPSITMGKMVGSVNQSEGALALLSETLGMHSAYQIEITDRDLQAYLQRYPFAGGPERARNLVAIEAVIRGLRPRSACESANTVLLKPKDTSLSEAELARLTQAFGALGFDRKRQRALIDDFAWEANMAPRSASNVLVIGCGDGMELIFLRAVLPDARITALDYRDGVSSRAKEIVRAEIIAGDFNLSLGSQGGFDLISSNHTLEHLYAPDQTLEALLRALVPGGTLISTLPMDGNPGSPFLRKVQRMAFRKRVNRPDFVFLDAGHPWKTCPGDLVKTFRAAGFSDVTLYQRAWHPCRGATGGKLRRRLTKTTGLALHALFFGPIRWLAKALPAGRVQETACRFLLAVEGRVWFGSNGLKNRFTEEALVCAKRAE